MFDVRVRRTFGGEIIAYVVTDQPKDWDDDWPYPVEFPVSIKHYKDVQYQRALEYCEYLNRIAVTPPSIGEITK